VHVSVVFTWDRKKGLELKRQWEAVCSKVKIGGPAFDSAARSFIPGKYVQPGVIFTSRGCPNNCDFCFVPQREGKLRELKIEKGNMIADNNITACSPGHLDSVFKMLSKQKKICFAGGLESARMTDEFIERLRGVRIHQLWLAFDNIALEGTVRKAIRKLRKYFTQRKLRCYVLIGYKDDTIERAESRLWKAAEMGSVPFAMFYRDMDRKRAGREWDHFRWKWANTAAVCARLAARGLL